MPHVTISNPTRKTIILGLKCDSEPSKRFSPLEIEQYKSDFGSSAIAQKELAAKLNPKIEVPIDGVYITQDVEQMAEILEMQPHLESICGLVVTQIQ